MFLLVFLHCCFLSKNVVRASTRLGSSFGIACP